MSGSVASTTVATKVRVETIQRRRASDTPTPAHNAWAKISTVFPPSQSFQGAVPRNRSALKVTDAELKLMASAAIMGDNNQPVKGYNNPAAIGMPSAL